MGDEELYLKVENELKGKPRKYTDRALWAKAKTLCKGDEEKTRFKYIKLRVEKLKEVQKIKVAEEEKKKKDKEKLEEFKKQRLEEIRERIQKREREQREKWERWEQEEEEYKKKKEESKKKRMFLWEKAVSLSKGNEEEARKKMREFDTKYSNSSLNEVKENLVEEESIENTETQKKHLDNRELYLYGTLLALTEEQSMAISKLTRKEIGWWGKGRIQSRGREIGNFLQQIIDYKVAKGSKNSSEDIRADLEYIKSGNLPKNYSEACFRTLESYTANFL